jgi:hypothetical protein
MEFKFRGWVSALLERLEPKPQVQIRLKRVEPLTPYRAVSVRAGPESCQAAKQFGKKRFLSSRAPRIPLPECTCATCTCSYIHHDDRRTGIDRRQMLGKAPVDGIVERRINLGRRSTDAVGFNDPGIIR